MNQRNRPSVIFIAVLVVRKGYVELGTNKNV